MVATCPHHRHPEPVPTQHRLIDESVVRTNATMTGEDLRYSLLYQLTHITRDRGSPNHDDRLEALAGAVYHFMRSAGQDIDEAAQALRDHQMDLEIEAFVESYNRPQQRVPRRRMNIVGDPASLDDNAWIFEKGYDGSPGTTRGARWFSIHADRRCSTRSSSVTAATPRFPRSASARTVRQPSRRPCQSSRCLSEPGKRCEHRRNRVLTTAWRR